MPLCCIDSCETNLVSEKLRKFLKFYRFPFLEKEPERREIWIKAVNKKFSDGTLWHPDNNSVICEKHFVNKFKSDAVESPSFNPTLNLNETTKVCKIKRQQKDTTVCIPSKTLKVVENDSKELLLHSSNIPFIAVQSTTSTQSPQPGARWGHSMSMLDKQTVIMIGGQGSLGDCCKDMLWKLDLSEVRWMHLSRETKGSKPGSRIGHTATYDPLLRCLYVYGGKRKKWRDGLYVLDVERNEWTLQELPEIEASTPETANSLFTSLKSSKTADETSNPNIETPPQPTESSPKEDNGTPEAPIDSTNNIHKFRPPLMAYHSCVSYKHKLFFYGGTTPSAGSQEMCNGQLYVYDCLQQCWSAPAMHGDLPARRSGHTSTLLNNKMVMFGGWDDPLCFNDTHILDLDTLHWHQPTLTGPVPSPRSWHSACLLHGNRVMVHGGFNGNTALKDMFVLNIEEQHWTSLLVQPYLGIRAGHTSICLPHRHDNQGRDQVVMFGGGDNDDCFYSDLINIMVPLS